LKSAKFFFIGQCIYGAFRHKKALNTRRLIHSAQTPKSKKITQARHAIYKRYRLYQAYSAYKTVFYLTSQNSDSLSASQIANCTC